MNGFTQEVTPFLGIKSPEITLYFSRKVKTNHLLRIYANMRTAQRSTVNLRALKGGKAKRAKRVARAGERGVQPNKTSGVKYLSNLNVIN